VNPHRLENQLLNKSLGLHHFLVCRGTWASFYLVSNLINYLILIIDLVIEIILGYCSQWVRLGVRVIESPPTLSLLSCIIVKLLSQADQVPYREENWSFGQEIQ
jgi:hypothetical protein